MKKDYNSTTNQEIKGKLVQREVLTCFSYEMDTILKVSAEHGNIDLPNYEDIENLYLNCEKEYKNYGYESAEAMQNDGADIQEIFEYWIVTEYLYNKLKAKGQPVLEFGNNCYWGRCTTGQAILLDLIISEICEDMEILEGQKYSWAKK